MNSYKIKSDFIESYMKCESITEKPDSTKSYIKDESTTGKLILVIDLSSKIVTYDNKTFLDDESTTKKLKPIIKL